MECTSGYAAWKVRTMIIVRTSQATYREVHFMYTGVPVPVFFAPKIALGKRAIAIALSTNEVTITCINWRTCPHVLLEAKKIGSPVHMKRTSGCAAWKVRVVIIARTLHAAYPKVRFMCTGVAVPISFLLRLPLGTR